LKRQKRQELKLEGTDIEVRMMSNCEVLSCTPYEPLADQIQMPAAPATLLLLYHSLDSTQPPSGPQRLQEAVDK
jgi:hypothetical protein